LFSSVWAFDTRERP